MSIEFSYRLTGAGWSEASISDGHATATLTASYLEDALGDLLDAVGVLLEGSTDARCSWEEEPGEYRWIFSRLHQGRGTIRQTERFDEPEQCRFDWAQSYTRDQWLDLLPTTGGLTQLHAARGKLRRVGSAFRRCHGAVGGGVGDAEDELVLVLGLSTAM